MGKGKILLVVIIGAILSACNMEAMESKQAKEFDELALNFTLTPEEIDIAKRVMAGYKNELGTSVLPSRDLHQAICYATSIDMPDRLERAHYLYLDQYAEADIDYLNWFKTHGVDRESATEMGSLYIAVHDTCKTTRGRLDNMKMLKARR